MTDDESESDEGDDDEYIEDYPRAALSKVSVRRPSSASIRRSLLNGKSATGQPV